MTISMIILIVLLLFEIVHVQLSHKRGEVVMLEIARKDFLRKLCGFFDHQSCAVRSPADEFAVLVILEHVIDFSKEFWYRPFLGGRLGLGSSFLREFSVHLVEVLLD